MVQLYKRIGAVITAAMVGIGIISGCPAVKAVPVGVSSVRKQIPVCRKSLSVQETVECTFFSDLPHIPYIPLERFYSVFMNGDMKVTRNGTRYTYEDQQYGSIAVADAEQDTLTSLDMADFLATPVYKQQGGLVMGGPDQLVKVEEVAYDQPAVAVTLSMGQYGIDLREADGVLYFPFATVSDLFSNPDVQTAYYADDIIYYEADYEELNGGPLRGTTMTWPWILSAQREADMITFNYHELCFSIESFYGYPCSYNSFTDAMQKDGLDAALSVYEPEVRSLLLSEKPGEYVAGLYRLFNILLADGGHTGVALNGIFDNSRYKAAVSKDFFLYSHYTEHSGYYVEKNRRMVETYNTLSEQRLKELGAGGYYTKGDTALISFERFEVEYAQWNDYLSGNRKFMPDDTIGFVYRCLEQADKDPSVKNVVFDLSTNGGGDTIALEMLMCLIQGTFECRFYNVLGQQTITQTTTADTNFDGVINEDDRITRYPYLRFAVLSSGYAFSCANIMTALMKESGCPVLGENSAGGACAVLIKATADGMSYNMSSYVRFVSTLTDTVDDGITADISLVSESAGGQKDYSRFYDLSAISQAVNRYYDGQESISDIPSIPSVPSPQSTPAVDTPSSQVTEITSAVSPAQKVSTPSAVSVVSAAEASSDGTMFLVFVLFGIVAAAVIAVAVVVVVKK